MFWVNFNFNLTTINFHLEISNEEFISLYFIKYYHIVSLDKLTLSSYFCKLLYAIFTLAYLSRIFFNTNINFLFTLRLFSLLWSITWSNFHRSSESMIDENFEDKIKLSFNNNSIFVYKNVVLVFCWANHLSVLIYFRK